MSPQVFKKLVKKTFHLKLSDKELAAIVSEFGYNKNNNTVSCSEFLVKFIQWGADRRASERLSELENEWTRTEMDDNNHNNNAVVDEDIADDNNNNNNNRNVKVFTIYLFSFYYYCC